MERIAHHQQTHSESNSDRQYIKSSLPDIDPSLQELFATICQLEIQDEPFIHHIDELDNKLAGAGIDAVLACSNPHSTHKDQLSYLHEKFLEQYNPQLRELRGVYYTPDPVVSYIVRSIDLLLRFNFNCQDGLAEEEERLILLDPACGTGIFLQAVIQHIRAEFQKTSDTQKWQDYVHTHLLPHLFGYELLTVPYLIAHLKLASQLAAFDLPESERHAWAYHFEKDEHLNIYLTNTLEQGVETRTRRGQAGTGHAQEWTGRGQAPPLLCTNQEEHKSEYSRGGACPRPAPCPRPCPHPTPVNPIMVIFGNPPYAGHSANKGQWINLLLDSYKEGCPELKKPGQAKWLSDDYVKFMRFAQWHIEQAGYGILAFITNHSYLDNPTFRGMRRSLLQSFDDIYILDLHGNSKKHEQAPDGSKDENVFDIQQGVAISIFVKWQDSKREGVQGAEGHGAGWRDQGGERHGGGAQGTGRQGGERHGGGAQGGASPAPTLFATVHHADLWGLREVYELDAQGHAVLTGGKYSWLAEHDLASTHWTVLNPQVPFYPFTPQDNRYLAEYETGWSVAAIFRPNGDPAPGVVTCHDQFAISWTVTEASDKVERLLSTETEDEARQLFRLCSQHQWQYPIAKNALRGGAWRQDITEILYRPFDRRWTIFNRYVAVHRRERVMRHMLAGENIGLTIGRAGQVIDQDEWDIAFCTRLITEFNLYRRGGNNLFPLYLYDDASPGDRKANLAVDFIADCTTRLRMAWIPGGHGDLDWTFGPEDIFTYMYAIFYSPTYRKRYAPFLKIDFPRLPLTTKRALFRALCSIGERLVGLHLMEQRTALISSFPVQGDNCVEAVRYITPVQPEIKGPVYSHTSNDASASIVAEQQSGGVKGQVWINATQYFDNVPLEAWNFSIGGYRVCKKWLKDRKGHKLSGDDLTHYQQIVAILAETSRLMREIDEVIENNGGWPL